MEAKDKMYVHSYYEYDDLRRWAIAYYPELLFYFYNITLTWSEYADNVKEWAEQAEKRVKKEYAKLGHYYSELLEDNYTFPVMNTPFNVDKKLKWICPVPCVRKYLEEHCGYKTKWYHKLFWKGKKHFK